MVGAANLQVERRDGIIGGGDVGVEVGLGDILGQSLSSLFRKSVWDSNRSLPFRLVKSHREL